MARPQSQADQRARIRHRLRLPAMVGLIAPHGLFTRLIPRPSRRAAQVVLANQRFLDRMCPLRIDFLLPPRRRLPSALVRSRVRGLAAVRCDGCLGFRVRRARRFRLRCRGVGLGTSSRLLRKSRPQRDARTDQRQSAPCSQPSPHFRAMLPFQRQSSNPERTPLH